MGDKFILEKPRKTPVTENVDVFVAGGGPSGVMAAIAAARLGCSVVLAESKAYFGGAATMGLPIQGYYNQDNQRIVAGLAEEFRQHLIKKNGASKEFIQCTMHNPFLIVDPEKVKLVCAEMLKQAGVRFLLHTQVVDTIVEDGVIQAVLLEGKSGREAVVAKQYIDCTGDADLAARSGVPFSIGSEKDGTTQASTLNFRMDSVDIQVLVRALFDNPKRYDLHHLLPREQFRGGGHHIMVGLGNLIEEAKSEGFMTDAWSFVNYITQLDENAVSINSVHVKNKNACDTRDLTFIEVEARNLVQEMAQFLKLYVPGFENSRLTFTAGWSGIRETRRVHGEKTITADDILAGNRPQDTIALGGYPIDIHSSNENGLVFQKVPTYGISYGCLVPLQCNNLLVAGRSISATHEAMASTRLMAQCMAMGEAAGTAAFICVENGCFTRDVDVSKLRSILDFHGACL
ncbi:MAG: FAD-dependent oxidoreductase [Clostridiaceae bacterium]|jgi:glycine/D-amino acid oxidase-like deaminating enzyme|nr:FAD-dependent oxidoreductase [Clostridiaceae bacterium]